MTYQEILANARTCMGPYCKSCPVCNGAACKNAMPGPGAKGSGTGAMRNYQKWQEICVNMDTICENKPVDTTAKLFGREFVLPVFAGPVGALQLHYGDKYNDLEYNDILVSGCAAAGIETSIATPHNHKRICFFIVLFFLLIFSLNYTKIRKAFENKNAPSKKGGFSAFMPIFWQFQIF